MDVLPYLHTCVRRGLYTHHITGSTVCVANDGHARLSTRNGTCELVGA